MVFIIWLYAASHVCLCIRSMRWRFAALNWSLYATMCDAHLGDLVAYKNCRQTQALGEEQSIEWVGGWEKSKCDCEFATAVVLAVGPCVVLCVVSGETAANLKKQHGKTLKPSLDHFQQMQHDQPFASVWVCVCVWVYPPLSVYVFVLLRVCVFVFALQQIVRRKQLNNSNFLPTWHRGPLTQ